MKLQYEEVSNLKNELEHENKNKFVAQNVEGQSEIVKLKRELTQSTTLHTLEVNMRKALEDKVKRLNNRASTP